MPISFHVINDYLKKNTIAGLSRKPRFVDWHIIFPVSIFAILSIVIGFGTNLFEPGLINSNLSLILPLSLFIFPSLLEELFFRGILIPIGAAEKSATKKLFYLLFSTLVFVLWHPLNALTINQSAQYFFLDIRFLFITFLLGLACGYTYMHSKSIWVPVIIHWLAVIVWVFFLGGRNLILE